MATSSHLLPGCRTSVPRLRTLTKLCKYVGTAMVTSDMNASGGRDKVFPFISNTRWGNSNMLLQLMLDDEIICTNLLITVCGRVNMVVPLSSRKPQPSSQPKLIDVDLLN